MRAYELYEFKTNTGVYNPNDDDRVQYAHAGRRPKVTLGQLNRLKHINKRRQADLEKKADFLALMYGDDSQKYEAEKMELERQQHELEMLMDKISNEVDKAEISKEDQDRIHQMAMNHICSIHKF